MPQPDAFTQPADLTFLTEDHPAADGRQPRLGEVAWTLRFPLEQGRTLAIDVGMKTLLSFKAMIRAMEADEALEAAFRANPENVVHVREGGHDYYG